MSTFPNSHLYCQNGICKIVLGFEEDSDGGNGPNEEEEDNKYFYIFYLYNKILYKFFIFSVILWEVMKIVTKTIKIKIKRKIERMEKISLSEFT